MRKKVQLTIDIDMENGQTKVGGTGDEWEDLAYLLEGLTVMILENCRAQGKAPDEMAAYCLEYLKKSLADYKMETEE